MNGLILRRASLNDSDFAYGARKAAFKEYVEEIEGWDEAMQRRLHEERFVRQDFRVISVAGTDVGVMAIAVTPDCVKLNQLFLLPEHQGKDIGRRCMMRIMVEARELGLPVCLRVLKVNPRARAFYERLGFVRAGDTETHDLLQWNSQRAPAGRALTRAADARAVDTEPSESNRRE